MLTAVRDVSRETGGEPIGLALASGGRTLRWQWLGERLHLHQSPAASQIPIRINGKQLMQRLGDDVPILLREDQAECSIWLAAQRAQGMLDPALDGGGAGSRQRVLEEKPIVRGETNFDFLRTKLHRVHSFSGIRISRLKRVGTFRFSRAKAFSISSDDRGQQVPSAVALFVVLVGVPIRLSPRLLHAGGAGVVTSALHRGAGNQGEHDQHDHELARTIRARRRCAAARSREGCEGGLGARRRRRGLRHPWDPRFERGGIGASSHGSGSRGRSIG